MRTGLVVLIGVGWIGCGPLLAWFMGKRGYDAISWLAVGALIGPGALALVLMERVPWTQARPEVVLRARTNGGSIDVLIVMDGGTDVVPVARPLIEWFGDCLGRLTIARVLPEGGPGEEQVRATRAIEEAAARMAPHLAEGLLLFGSTASALGAFVRDAHFDVVITAGPNVAVKDSISNTDVLHVDGPQYAPALSPIRSRRDSGLHRTNSDWTSR